MSQRIFVVGASWAGIEALCELAAALPADFPAPIFVVQHVSPHSPSVLPQILTRAGRLPASHPQSGQLIKPGHIYVAPPNRHMLLRMGYVSLSHGPRENHTRPAVDALFRSAALAYGPAVVGAVLTGQLDDGTVGLLTIKDRGGVTVVQDPKEAIAPSMPESAMRHVGVDHCCTLREMAALFVDLAGDDPPSVATSDLDELFEVENRIAAGIFNVADWGRLAQLSAPSGLICPECRSALYEIEDPRFLRFRCRSGHAYSAESLLRELGDAREGHLSSLFGALIAEAALAKRLRGQLGAEAGRREIENLDFRVRKLEGRAEQVCGWLREMTGPLELTLGEMAAHPRARARARAGIQPDSGGSSREAAPLSASAEDLISQ